MSGRNRYKDCRTHEESIKDVLDCRSPHEESIKDARDCWSPHEEGIKDARNCWSNSRALCEKFPAHTSKAHAHRQPRSHSTLREY